MWIYLYLSKFKMTPETSLKPPKTPMRPLWTPSHLKGDLILIINGHLLGVNLKFRFFTLCPIEVTAILWMKHSYKPTEDTSRNFPGELYLYQKERRLKDKHSALTNICTSPAQVFVELADYLLITKVVQIVHNNFS